MKSSNLRAKPAPARGAKLLKIVYRAVEELKPDPANPRRHSKKQIRQIANSIREFGFVTPVLIDRDDKVIAGHGRLLACPELGITEVPTVRLDHLTPAQARAFMIADNRLTEIASWDDRLLAEQLKELSLLDLDFSLELTGFEVGEIDLRIASLGRCPTRLTTRPILYLSFPSGRRSANEEIYGSLETIGFCAATPSIPPISRC
jgi:hypothetical protein